MDEYKNYIIIIHANLIHINNHFFFPEPLCIPENVYKFNKSDILVTNQSALCLACLFNGEGPQSSTVWMLNDQNITLQNSIAKVNDNGTLVIMQQPGPKGFKLTCQHGESMFNLTLKGEVKVYIIGGSSIILLDF